MGEPTTPKRKITLAAKSRKMGPENTFYTLVKKDNWLNNVISKLPAETIDDYSPVGTQIDENELSAILKKRYKVEPASKYSVFI